jgi:hypothetical protein
MSLKVQRIIRESEARRRLLNIGNFDVCGLGVKLPRRFTKR